MLKTETPTSKAAAPTPEPALHLLAGRWLASCPTCGFELTSSKRQGRAERRAARRRCPVCYQDGA
jgi:hypothetical protein